MPVSPRMPRPKWLYRRLYLAATTKRRMLVSSSKRSPVMPAETRTPPHVELIRSFANTIDVDDDTDVLTTRRELTRWLHEQRLLARRTPSSEEDLRLARQLRKGIREAMAAHHGDDPVESADLGAATKQLP